MLTDSNVMLISIIMISSIIIIIGILSFFSKISQGRKSNLNVKIKFFRFLIIDISLNLF